TPTTIRMPLSRARIIFPRAWDAPHFTPRCRAAWKSVLRKSSTTGSSGTATAAGSATSQANNCPTERGEGHEQLSPSASPGGCRRRRHRCIAALPGGGTLVGRGGNAGLALGDLLCQYLRCLCLRPACRGVVDHHASWRQHPPGADDRAARRLHHLFHLFLRNGAHAGNPCLGAGIGLRDGYHGGLRRTGRLWPVARAPCIRIMIGN